MQVHYNNQIIYIKQKTKLKYLGYVLKSGSCEIGVSLQSPAVDKYYTQFNNMVVLGKHNNEQKFEVS